MHYVWVHWYRSFTERLTLAYLNVSSPLSILDQVTYIPFQYRWYLLQSMGPAFLLYTQLLTVTKFTAEIDLILGEQIKECMERIDVILVFVLKWYLKMLSILHCNSALCCMSNIKNPPKKFTRYCYDTTISKLSLSSTWSVLKTGT